MMNEKYRDSERAEMWRDYFETTALELKELKENYTYLVDEYRKEREKNKRLRQSLKVVMNIDTTPPEQAIYSLRDEILSKIEKDASGTIYRRPLLIGMIKTRIMGKPGQFYESSAQMKESALNNLFNPVAPKKPGVLIESGNGTITRSGETIPYRQPITGIFKSYLQRV